MTVSTGDIWTTGERPVSDSENSYGKGTSASPKGEPNF